MTVARLLAPLALVLVTGALVSILWLAPPSRSAGEATTATLADVAERPREFMATPVTLSGGVAPGDYLSPADADAALVLGDGAGHRLLVMPQRGAHVAPGITRSSALRVTGEVRPLRPRPARRDRLLELSVSDLAARVGATAVLHASSVERTDGAARRRSGRRAIVRSTVARLRSGPRRRLAGKLVAVSGDAHRVMPTGFVLVGARRSIFVAAPAAELAEIDAGEHIRVRGTLERMSPYRAATAEEALAATPEAGSGAPGGVRLDRTPAAPGARYIVLRELSGADD